MSVEPPMATESDSAPSNVLVRRYRLYEPLDWAGDAEEHLQLQVKFWNALVALERDQRSQYEAILSAQSERLVALQDQYAAAQREIEALIAQRSAARKTGRSKQRDGEFAQPIAAVKARIKELGADLRDERKAAKAAAAAPLKKLYTARFAAVKACFAALLWRRYCACADECRLTTVLAAVVR